MAYISAISDQIKKQIVNSRKFIEFSRPLFLSFFFYGVQEINYGHFFSSKVFSIYYKYLVSGKR